LYHEVTYAEIARRKRMRIILAVLVVFLCANIALAAFLSANVSRKQAAVSVREAVITASVQCAAVEGSYPSSLSHLESHYGLVINQGTAANFVPFNTADNWLHLILGVAMIGLGAWLGRDAMDETTTARRKM